MNTAPALQHHDAQYSTTLAYCLDLLERGVAAQDNPTCYNQPRVRELLEVAEQLRDLPPVKPRQSWIDASRARLLARFSARPA